jgi:hypothetical protein
VRTIFIVQKRVDEILPKISSIAFELRRVGKSSVTTGYD